MKTPATPRTPRAQRDPVLAGLFRRAGYGYDEGLQQLVDQLRQSLLQGARPAPSARSPRPSRPQPPR